MKYHIVDDHCGIIGGEDYGYVESYEEAEAAIVKRKEQGYRGGCRCNGSGWKIMTCNELTIHMETMKKKYWFIINDEHRCVKYEESSMSFDEQMAKINKTKISDLYMTGSIEERPFRLISENN